MPRKANSAGHHLRDGRHGVEDRALDTFPDVDRACTRFLRSKGNYGGFSFFFGKGPKTPPVPIKKNFLIP
jgi:hypothetical protein